ncbi:MAG TPA: LamG domain-containing protein, partial [Polyangia bacterium]
IVSTPRVGLVAFATACLVVLACRGPNPAFRAEPDAAGAPDGPPAEAAPVTPVDAAGAGDVAAPPIDLPVVVTDGAGEDGDLLPAADTTDAEVAAPVLPVALGHWRLDETSGTVTNDERAVNPGTLTKGATFRAGGFLTATFRNPGSVLLDGKDGFIELGVRSLPSMGKPMTVTAWFWLPSTPTGRKNVIAITNPTEARAIQIGLENGKMAIWGWDAPVASLSAATAAPFGWHHIAYTFDGTVHSLYQDGRLIDASPVIIPISTIRFLRVGAFDPAEGEKLAGVVDDIRVYGVPLDAAQIAHLFSGRE